VAKLGIDVASFCWFSQLQTQAQKHDLLLSNHKLSVHHK
jgi:hypothetical protein